MKGKLDVESFLAGYRAFAESRRDLEWVRYEDFVQDPDGVLRRLCRGLALPFDDGWRERWARNHHVTGDKLKVGVILTDRINDIDPETRRRFEANADYAETLALLGYDREN